MEHSSLQSFQLIKDICGDDALKNLVIVTNMWSKVSSKTEGNTREHQLRTDSRFFESALAKGAKFLQHDNTRASGYNIIREILKNHPMVLRLQRELVEDKSHLSNTMAGKELFSQMRNLAKTFEDRVAKLKKRLGIPANEKPDIRDLQTKLAEVEEKFSSVVKNMGKLQSDSFDDKLVSVAYVSLTCGHFAHTTHHDR
jgi:hypothetical protein